MKKYTKIALALVVILVGSFLWFQSHPNKKDEKSKESKEKVEVRTIENIQLVSGKLNSSKEINLKSELAGVIVELYVQVGQRVSKGQAIAKIKTLPDPRSLQDADRQIAITNVNFERQKSNFQRNKTLFEKDVISKNEFELSKQEYSLAEAEHLAAIKNKRIVQQGFSNKSDFVSNVIYSTIDGIVLEIPTKVGATIMNRNNFNEGTTIATISDMNEILFKGQVNEKDLSTLTIGMPLTIQVNALRNQKFEAHLSKISPKGIDVSGITKFDIEAMLALSPSDISKMKSGFTATASFTIEKRTNVLAIEEKYVQYKEDSAFVTILEGDKSNKKLVKTGISDGKYIEILSGLKKGDLLSDKTETIEP